RRSHIDSPRTFTEPSPPQTRTLSLHDALPISLAETVNGLYKTELIRGPGRGPWKTIEEVELATLGWVHWHNTERLHSYLDDVPPDRKSTRLNSSHVSISYAVFCLKKKKNTASW